MSLSRYEWTSPVGELVLASFNDKLCMADWKYRKMRPSIDKRIQSFYQADFENKSTPIIERTISQLEEYFNKTRTQFDLNLDLIGTEFQKSVWNALIDIPFGKSMSYLKLAQNLNNEGAIRAVASANGANAISIIVPCHRIIGSNGDLVGYAGGLPAKKKLLSLEGIYSENLLF